MATVRLSFSPAPAHVRTARLVGVAVARRAGVPEELLEEIRLAIGEACSRAVALHRTSGLDELVDVTIEDEERFTVRVIDRAGNGLAVAAPPTDPALFLSGPGDDAGTTGYGGYPGPSQFRETVPYGGSPAQAAPDSEFDYRLPSPGSLADPMGASPMKADPMSEEAVAAGMGLALLAGLVDDLDVVTTGDGGGTEVRMSWPLGRRAPDG